MVKKRILIDLDGVLNNYDGGYNPNVIPEIRIGAKEFIREIANEYELKVFTTRNKELTEKWLTQNDIGKYFEGVTNIKEPSYLIIDDRGIRFNGNYNATLNEIHKFKVWWK